MVELLLLREPLVVVVAGRRPEIDYLIDRGYVVATRITINYAFAAVAVEWDQLMLDGGGDVVVVVVVAAAAVVGAAVADLTRELGLSCSGVLTDWPLLQRLLLLPLPPPS